MKFKNIILLSLVLIFISSCSEEYKMKKDFKEAYTEIMNDADSYELVSFRVFQKAFEYSEENQRYIDNYTELKNKSLTFMEVLDSLYKIEDENNPKFHNIGALVKIRGRNSYGGKVLSEHIAYYSSDGKLQEIDGNFVLNNRILNWK